MIKWPFCFWCKDKKEWGIWQACPVQSRQESDLSLWVGGLLHKSFSRDQLLYDPVASAHVGNFATETICPLSNERIVAPWLCSAKSVTVSKGGRERPSTSLIPGHCITSWERHSTHSCFRHRPTGYVVLSHYRMQVRNILEVFCSPLFPLKLLHKTRYLYWMLS